MFVDVAADGLVIYGFFLKPAKTFFQFLFGGLKEKTSLTRSLQPSSMKVTQMGQ